MHPTHSTLHITRDHTNLQSSPALPTGANIVRRDEACKERRRVVVVLKNMVITEGKDTIHLTIIDPKRLTNPITSLLIGDKLGPLDNVRRLERRFFG